MSLLRNRYRLGSRTGHCLQVMGSSCLRSILGHQTVHRCCSSRVESRSAIHCSSSRRGIGGTNSTWRRCRHVSTNRPNTKRSSSSDSADYCCRYCSGPNMNPILSLGHIDRDIHYCQGTCSQQGTLTSHSHPSDNNSLQCNHWRCPGFFHRVAGSNCCCSYTSQCGSDNSPNHECHSSAK